MFAPGTFAQGGRVAPFINRRDRDARWMVKLLVWTRSGFTIVHKRLDDTNELAHEQPALAACYGASVNPNAGRADCGDICNIC